MMGHDLLEKIQSDMVPSVNRGIRIWPIEIALDDGRTLPRVVGLSESDFDSLFGSRKRFDIIDPTKIIEAREAKVRLSVGVANRIYLADWGIRDVSVIGLKYTGSPFLLKYLTGPIIDFPPAAPWFCVGRVSGFVLNPLIAVGVREKPSFSICFLP